MMYKSVIYKNTEISYELEFKNVKNVNLRIKSDGQVYVSANKRVPQKFIDEFIISKGEFILKAIEKSRMVCDEPQKPFFTENEVKEIILSFCREIYPYYETNGVEFPEIKFRKMISRWGSCNSSKGIITFNTLLMYAPIECVKYVVWHEFTHFLQANHSKKYYNELEKVCPDWKIYRKALRGIHISKQEEGL